MDKLIESVERFGVGGLFKIKFRAGSMGGLPQIDLNRDGPLNKPDIRVYPNAEDLSMFTTAIDELDAYKKALSMYNQLKGTNT